MNKKEKLLLKVKKDLENAINKSRKNLVENDYWFAFIHLSNDIEEIIEKINKCQKRLYE